MAVTEQLTSYLQTCTHWITNIISTIIDRIGRTIMFLALAVYYFAESFLVAVAPSFAVTAKDISGKVVLITGGAGGVGKELVILLARKRAKVIVWDTNEKALASLIETCSEQDIQINTHVVDISQRELVYKYANIIKEEFGPIDILINNAGIVCGQTLLDIPDYMIERTFKVNIISHYWTAKAVLPDMIKQKSGHIVTVGSLTGFLGTYKCTDYSASKYATIGFHESLMTELKVHGHHNIKMTLVCPYFIDTGMFEGCKPRSIPMLKPIEVAKQIVKGIQREEVLVTLPAFARYLLPLKHYIPQKLMWTVLIRVIEFPQAMMGLRTFKEVEAA